MVFLLCFAFPMFFSAPLGLLAAAVLGIKGYARAAGLVGLGVVCMLTAWALGFVVLGLRAEASQAGTALSWITASLVLVGNVFGCEGAARAGGKPRVPPGLFYVLGVAAGAIGLCLIPFGDGMRIAETLSTLFGVMLAIWVYVGLCWTFSGGMLLAVVRAFWLAPVGGYDAVDSAG